jgi:phosphatidylglycerol:prolipoprotein diacylglycerol transferase
MIFSYINWNVNPEIFPNTFLPVRWYGLMFVFAFYLGFLIMQKIFKKEGIKPEVLDKLTIYMLLATIVGARLGHCFFYDWDYYSQNPIEILYVWQGGLASHGAGIGIIAALILFVRKVKVDKIDYFWILDRIVITVALAGFFIRMGNLFNSEIYGHETTLPWGFIFERNGETQPKHPTQIYEALSYLLIFIFLIWWYFKKDGNPRPGFLFSIFLITVFTARFFIEFIKEVQVDKELEMTLNLGQKLSIPFVLIGIGILVWSLRKRK